MTSQHEDKNEFTSLDDLNGELHINAEDCDKVYVLSRNSLKLSSMLTTVMDHVTDANRSEKISVQEEQLQFVVEYLKYHESKEATEITKQVVSANQDGIKDSFDKDFINKFSYEALTKLMTSANYLGIIPLVHLCAYRVAGIFTFGTDKEKDEVLDSFGRRTKDVSSDDDDDDDTDDNNDNDDKDEDKESIDEKEDNDDVEEDVSLRE